MVRLCHWSLPAHTVLLQSTQMIHPDVTYVVLPTPYKHVACCFLCCDRMPLQAACEQSSFCAIAQDKPVCACGSSTCMGLKRYFEKLTAAAEVQTVQVCAPPFNQKLHANMI